MKADVETVSLFRISPREMIHFDIDTYFYKTWVVWKTKPPSQMGRNRLPGCTPQEPPDLQLGLPTYGTTTEEPLVVCGLFLRWKDKGCKVENIKRPQK